MLQRTTTLPAVPGSQNGSGVSATRVERFDTLGNVVWSMDERGYISYNEYDARGDLAQSVQDVDGAQLTLPDGWSTPADGGLHVTTDHEHDLLGRQIQTLGPEHDVDGQTVRTATWTVHRDGDRETWTATGYAVGTTYTLVGPVSIAKRDVAGREIESIQATRASSAGKLGGLWGQAVNSE